MEKWAAVFILALSSSAASSSARAQNDQLALTRLNNAGSLDASFGVGGRATLPMPESTSEQLLSAALASNGKIVAAGWALIDGRLRFLVARFNANGTPDSSFSNDGRLTVSFGAGTDASGLAAAVDADGKVLTTVPGTTFSIGMDVAIGLGGKIVLGGYAGQPGFSAMVAARYLSNGNLDTTFDGNGTATVSFLETKRANATSVLSDSIGKVTLVGVTQ
jgi:uncharacterized delta-60 repeat protein